MNLFEKGFKIFKIDRMDDFVRRCITKKFFYSFCSIVFFEDMIKFSASNEKNA